MLAVLLSLLVGAAVAAEPADVPWHSVTSVSITAAGWKNASITGLSGDLTAWAIRPHTGCTSTSYVPVLVDQVATSGSGVPVAMPPAEYRVAETSSQAVVASATEASFMTSFAEPMPFVGGLNLWVNVTGGTTCTLVVSLWGHK